MTLSVRLSVGWPVSLSQFPQKSGKFHFQAPIGALDYLTKNQYIFFKETDRDYLQQRYFILYNVFINYCVFLEDFKIFWTLAFFCFPSVSVCVYTTGKILRKNTIFSEHPVEHMSERKNWSQGYCLQAALNTGFASLSQLAIRRQLCVLRFDSKVSC